MKKFLFLGLGSALLFTMGGVGPAAADNGPHVSTAGAENTTFSVAGAGATRCASCHRAHTAQASDLLKAAQPALCFSCHAAGLGADTDVVNGKDSNGAALRGGGFSFALIGSGAAQKTLGALNPATGRIAHSATIPVGVSAATTSKHQIDGTTSGTMWGNGAISATANPGKAAVTLECGSCHDPHGNGNYRILKPIPNDASNVLVPAVPAVLDNPATTVNEAAAAIPAVMSIKTGVSIPDAQNKNYTTNDYWLVTDRQVPAVKGGALPAVGVTDGYIANASQWCSTCHTRYLAGSGSYKTPNRGYPAVAGATGPVDATFPYRHRSERTDAAGVERPNCIQCHVSHGSNASMTGVSGNVTAPDGAAAQPVGAPKSSRLLRVDNRGTCVMCHNV